jgi:thiol-disulfide isomerase/thioredoxin
MQLPNIRVLLVLGIVAAIILYIFVLYAGKNNDGFVDVGEPLNVFTLYYMNGCPHCESILPTYKRFASAGQVEVNGKKTSIRMVEQGDPNAGPEIEERNIKGFPTFVLKTREAKYIEYKGERTIPAISQFIQANST